jgi:maleamate amidohydrolase
MKIGKERFEDHCWKDVVPPEDIKLYETYVRETYIGPNAAVLAIDLYNIVYRGGPHSPYELDATYPNSCGIYAHQAIAPTQAVLAAARAAGLPIIFCTKDVAASSRRGPTITGSTRLSRCARKTSSSASNAPASLKARR